MPGIVNINAFLTPPPAAGLSNDCRSQAVFHLPQCTPACGTAGIDTPYAFRMSNPSAPVSTNEMAAAVLGTDKRGLVGKRPNSDVEVNTVEVTNADENELLWKAIVRPRGIGLTGQLVPCAGCSIRKGIREGVSRPTSALERFPGVHRPRRAIRGFYRWVGVCDHVYRQRLEAAATVRA